MDAKDSPLGPGFFIFFRKKSDLGSGSLGPEYLITEDKTEDRIKQDDEEILLFIQTINKSLL